MGHHDADGLATSIQIRGGGRKVWIITRGYQPVLLRKKWSQSEAQCEHEKMVDQFKQQVKDAATDTWGETDDPTVPIDERRPPIDACVLDVSAGMMVYVRLRTCDTRLTLDYLVSSPREWFTPS